MTKFLPNVFLVLLLLFSSHTLLKAQNGANAWIPSIQHKIAHHDTPAMCMEFDWYGTAWDSVQASTFTYYPDGRQALIESEDFTSPFHHTFRSDTLIYDAQNRHIQTLAWRIYNTDTLYNLSEFEYDSHDHQWKTALYWKNDLSASWDQHGGIQSVRDYASDGRLLSEYRLEFAPFTSNAYDSVSYHTRHYDASLSLDTVVYYSFTGSTFEFSARVFDFTWYDESKGLANNATTQYWRNSNHWENGYRRSYTYGQHDSYLLIQEDWNSSSWVNDIKSETNYDQFGHAVERTYWKWFSNAWIANGSDRYTYTFDAQNRTQQMLQEDSFDHINYENKYLFTYQQVAVSADPAGKLQLDLTVSPNPATDQLHFNWEADKPLPAQLHLYDMQGRLIIASQVRRGDTEMDIRIAPMVANGTYTYALQVGERMARGRVVISR